MASDAIRENSSFAGILRTKMTRVEETEVTSAAARISDRCSYFWANSSNAGDSPILSCLRARSKLENTRSQFRRMWGRGLHDFRTGGENADTGVNSKSQRTRKRHGQWNRLRAKNVSYHFVTMNLRLWRRPYDVQWKRNSSFSKLKPQNGKMRCRLIDLKLWRDVMNCNFRELLSALIVVRKRHIKINEAYTLFERYASFWCRKDDV